MNETATRPSFVNAIREVLESHFERTGKWPEVPGVFKLCIDSGLPDATRAELEEACRQILDEADDSPANDNGARQ